MDMDGHMEEASRQVQVRFVTKITSPLKTPNTSIAIPSNLTRLGLSAIVNNLLKSGNPDWTNEPFDFLIEGELIRMSLEQFLLAKGISAEKILDIEYIRAVVPRKEEEPSLHDDWVSALDGSHSRFILTGCYDGLGRIWKAGGECTHLLDGHTDAVTSEMTGSPHPKKIQELLLQPIKSQELENFLEDTAKAGVDSVTIATGSKDHTLRLWKVDIEESNQTTMISPFKVLRGHKAAVQSLAANPAGDMVCSGSWDSTINLWRTDEVNAEDTSVVAKGDTLSSLVGHTQCVSSVVWKQHQTIHSASWDHSIRRWDVETGKESSNMLCGKALNCLDVGGEGSALIAAGASDPILRIWDPRKPGTSAPIFQFSSHNSWISACKWHDKSWFHLLYASYDGKVMLWDLRTTWPLVVIDSHKDKVLCADWWKGDSVASGGVDAKLFISSGIPIL